MSKGLGTSAPAWWGRLAILGALPLLAGLAGCGPGGTQPVAWHGYAALTPDSQTQQRPFIVLFCEYSDISSVPSGLTDEAASFLTLRGVGTGNIVDYWHDVSYNAVSVAGTRLDSTWYKPSYSTATYSGAGNRWKRVQACANAVPQADVDFSRYYGIIMFSNAYRTNPSDGNTGVGTDGGACYVGQQTLKVHGTDYPLACVVFDQYSLGVDFAAHEVGHALGYPHSYNDDSQWHCGSNQTAGEYGDPWDIMSAMCTWYFQGANQFAGYTDAAGPGVNAANLMAMGWIPYSTYTARQTAETTYTIAALSHPTAATDLALKIVMNPADPGDFYTVEYRQQDGWDAGIPTDTVLIHQVKALGAPPFVNPAPWSTVLRTAAQPIAGGICAGECEWEPPMTWTDPTSQVSVRVLSIDPARGTATIRVGPPSLTGNGVPQVRILAPQYDAQITAGEPFTLVAQATGGYGEALPDASVHWYICPGADPCPGPGDGNGTAIGTGPALPYTIPATYTQWGSATFAVVATDPGTGLSSAASILVEVNAPPPSPTAIPTATPTPAPSPSAHPSGTPSPSHAPVPTPTPRPTPPPPPSATILSPVSGQSYTVSSGQQATLYLSGQGSPGVTRYSWSDSLHLFVAAGANPPSVGVTQSQLSACGTVSDTITLEVWDAYNQTSTTTVTVSFYNECIQ